MRRIIQNSTAIAASLAMIVPQTGWAELRIPDEIAAEQGPQRAEEMPRLAEVLARELAAGLDEDALQCASGTERPCDDADTLVTPEGVAVELSERGSMVLAPRDQQINHVADDGSLLPISGAAEAEAEAAEAGLTDSEIMAAEAEAAQEAALAEEAAARAALAEAQAAEAEEAHAEAAAAADEAPAPAEDRPAPRDHRSDEAAEEEAAEAQPTEAEPAEAEAEEPAASLLDQATEAARDTAAGVTEAVTPLAQDAADATADAAAALAAALADAQADADTEEEAATAEVDVTPPAADALLALSDSETSLTRQQRQPRMAEILRAEVASGLHGSDLTCETGAPQPCGEGVALLTPQGVTVVTDDQGRLVLAPNARQVNRIASDGTLQPRAPEEDTPETAAATEAASEEAAPAVAALDEDAVADTPAVEQQVTEENTRSSGEDFESSLRDALAQAGQAVQPAPAEGQQARSSSSDLARALILGAGAVAVGTMLANNRQVALSTDDRVVVTRQDGSQEVIKDEVALLRQPGSTVTTENFDDGSSRTIVTREDGSRVVTIRDANLRVLRRTLISADGTRTQLIDDTADVAPVDVAALPPPARPVTITSPTSEEQLRAALAVETQANRRFTLGQIRNIPEVRALVAPIDIAAITFDTGSAAIKPDQARQLATLGKVISDAVRANPREIFMIEGHTDTVGSEAMNLALSDRRAESVALALTEYFQVPPENMVVQGYGERFLKIRAEGDIRENRRASVRRITDLLQTASN